MAVEASPVAAALAIDNWIASATFASATITHPLYPGSNVQNPHRSRRARSTSGTAIWSSIFDLGSAKFPTIFAVVDPNFGLPYSTSQRVILTGADDVAFSTNLLRYRFPTYECRAGNRVLTYYLSLATTPDTGTAGARRYWTLQVDGANETWGLDYFEAGVFWLGEYIDIQIDQGAKIELVDISARSNAYGGAEYVDALPVGAEIDLSLPWLTQTQIYALRRSAAGGFAQHAILDVHAYASDTGGNDYINIRPFSAYYGKLSEKGGLSLTLEARTRNTLGLRFVEARG